MSSIRITSSPVLRMQRFGRASRDPAPIQVVDDRMAPDDQDSCITVYPFGEGLPIDAHVSSRDGEITIHSVSLVGNDLDWSTIVMVRYGRLVTLDSFIKRKARSEFMKNNK